MNLFGRSLGWLYEALGLTEPAVPTELDTSHVRPTLDVLQGGWAFAEFRDLRVDRAASLAGSDELVFAVPENRIGLILGGSGAHNGGAAAQSVGFFVRHPAWVSGYGLRVLTIDVNAGWQTVGRIENNGTAAHRAGLLGSSPYPYFLPPGTELRANWPTTAVGETWQTSWLIALFPLGTKPL